MAEIGNFFAHGSRWVQADFHLHTRRDKEFKDAGSEQDFVTRYVAALKQADIRVGVITNHNKFDRDEFKALRKAAKQEEIYLMPGVELSVKDGRNGIHTLVVFHDEEWVDNRKTLTALTLFLDLPSPARPVTTTVTHDQTTICWRPFENLTSSQRITFSFLPTLKIKPVSGVRSMVAESWS